MAWLFLFLAGLSEVLSVTLIKLAKGPNKRKVYVFCGLAMISSLYCLSLSIKSIPIGTAYGVWTGIGSAGAAIAGILIFKESRHYKKLLCIGLIVIGVIGLDLTS